jgi:hypothetical protein
MPAIRPEIRGLTSAERALVAQVFGSAIDTDTVTVRNAKFWFFHPRRVTMAPDGHLWCHPGGDNWCADYAADTLGMQAHFIHEMTHVWQVQQGRKLIWARPPFARYRYELRLGKAFAAYGIEQQACIVADAFLLRRGAVRAGKPGLASYAAILPFGDWSAGLILPAADHPGGGAASTTGG